MAKDESTKSVSHCVFSLAGQNFALMEGQGQHGHRFSPAFSFIINCENQSEVDSYWQKLSEGGSEQQCGWLQDKYGLSWQVIPNILPELMSDAATSEKVMQAMLKMKKLNIAELIHAAEGR